MRRLYHERLEKKAFKMSIILILRDLEPQDRARIVDELTAKEFAIPYSNKKTISRTTIYAWLKEYREREDPSGVLMHKERSDRLSFRLLTDEQKKALTRWRYDNKYRTVAQLREELSVHESTNSGKLPSESTIARFLRTVGLDRRTLLKKDWAPVKVRLAYEAPYPQRLWMADTKGPNLNVKDPKNPGKLIIAKLVVVIDDNSRYLPGARYIYENEENEAVIMWMLMEAIALYGVPDILYLDRGGPYIGHNLKRAALLLGCRISHTNVRDAAAKGKIEKMLKFFYEKLETELMTFSSPVTIEEANLYLTALIRQDYHRTVHSATGQTPEERFFAYPANYRRFVSRKTLLMIFLPCAKAFVSKTGLIHLHKQEYLVPDTGVYDKYVEARWDKADPSKVYVWYEDRFIGEANLYLKENDFLKRAELLERVIKEREIVLPEFTEVPLYSYLERKLAAHRLEVENLSLNDELVQLKSKRAKVKAELIKLPEKLPEQAPPTSGLAEFRVDHFLHLLSVLFKRRLSAHERLAVHTAWQKYGPFDEALARKTVGTLLGENHPVSDLTGYLDALRIAAIASPKGEA